MISEAGAPERLAFHANAEVTLDEPDAVAAAIPGGTHEITPLDGRAFRGTVRTTYLGEGVALRSVAFDSSVLIRSHFVAPFPTLSFLLPCIRGRAAVLNGKDVDGHFLSSTTGGVRHQLRTSGAHEVGTITIDRESLFDAYDAMTGDRIPPCLHADANISGNHALLRELNALHRRSGGVADTDYAEGAASTPLRNRILATLIDTIATGTGKPDHLATRLQTASMARIDRSIDEHPDLDLRRLCRETGIALRTIETIIRGRTGFTALGYLRRRRMTFARRALLDANGGTTVTSVALNHGFPHLGRFAGDYRKLYGEPPSQTLSRRIGKM